MPNAYTKYGTKVEFRVKGKDHVEVRYFAHKNHGEEANKFVIGEKKGWDYHRCIAFNPS